MPSAEEQLKFLMSCVRYSNNGKVRVTAFTPVKCAYTFQIEFQDVANECGIVSKGAA